MRNIHSSLFVHVMLVATLTLIGCGDDESVSTSADATGGATTGGATTGGATTGGATTGGATTGGATTGGATTGGMATGGMATGGTPTGGMATGGMATGGMATGGMATGGMMMVTPSVTVQDQFPANAQDEVVVAEAVSVGAGWIVIHEQTMDGMIGPVLGNTALTDGTNTDVTVTLSRDVVDGEVLYAMLHTDMPADGMYTFDGMNGEDGPVQDAMGMVIAPPFTITMNVPTDEVNVSDQTLFDLSTIVTIDRVLADQAGWIVIHEQDGMGAIGPVIGFAAVSAGESLDVDVDLDRAAVEGETLYAMLHVDMPADGLYTFDGMNGEDGPVQDGNGMVIAPPFVVTVPAGTPAIRLTANNIGPVSYNWVTVEPASYASTIGNENTNQTITLRPGWRYEVVNNGFPTHPLELVTLGADRNSDTVILSQQNGNTTMLEGDMDVDWIEDNNSILFTVTMGLQNAVTGYRCSVPSHPMMRGTITYP